MQNSIMPDVLFNTIMMMRMRSNKTVLLVESSIDAVFYERFVNAGDCYLGNASHRDGVIALLERLANNRVPACAGIVDADCDYVLRRTRPNRVAFRTDTTDKETAIIDSDAFEAFCHSYHGGVDVPALRESLYSAALPLGSLRRLSCRDNLGLDFKQIEFSHFVQPGPRSNSEDCCVEVHAKNLSRGVTVQQLLGLLDDPDVRNVPKQHVVQGHDLTAILSMQSQAILRRTVSQPKVEEELSKCYLFSHFSLTKLFLELSEWEATVVPRFKLFSGSGLQTAVLPSS